MCILHDTYYACSHNAGQGMHRINCQRFEQRMLCTLECLRTVILSYCEPCQAALEDAGRRLLGYEEVVFGVEGITEDDYWGNSETNSEDYSEYDSENQLEYESEPDDRYRRFDGLENYDSTRQSNENNGGYERPHGAEPGRARPSGHDNGLRYYEQGNHASDEPESYQERRQDTQFYQRYTRLDVAGPYIRTRWVTEMDRREEDSSSEDNASSSHGDPMDIDIDIDMAN